MWLTILEWNKKKLSRKQWLRKKIHEVGSFPLEKVRIKNSNGNVLNILSLFQYIDVGDIEKKSLVEVQIFMKKLIRQAILLLNSFTICLWIVSENCVCTKNRWISIIYSYENKIKVNICIGSSLNKIHWPFILLQDSKGILGFLWGQTCPCSEFFLGSVHWGLCWWGSESLMMPKVKTKPNPP